MTLVDGLIHVMETEIPNFDNKQEVKLELEEAIYNQRFKVIRNDEDIEIGFFTWWEEVIKGKLYIFINNMFILKEHKGEYNLCKLRKWFRDMYPRAVFYWRSRKRKSNFEANERIGGHYARNN